MEPSDTQRTVLKLTCVDQPECRVSLEPEGSLLTLQEGNTLTLVIPQSDAEGIEISHLPDGLIVGVWSGAPIQILDDSPDR